MLSELLDFVFVFWFLVLFNFQFKGDNNNNHNSKSERSVHGWKVVEVYRELASFRVFFIYINIFIIITKDQSNVQTQMAFTIRLNICTVIYIN